MSKTKLKTNCSYPEITALYTKRALFISRETSEHPSSILKGSLDESCTEHTGTSLTDIRRKALKKKKNYLHTSVLIKQFHQCLKIIGCRMLEQTNFMITLT